MNFKKLINLRFDINITQKKLKTVKYVLHT